MIVATRLSAVWQVAGVAAAALCCYLVSQSVASERAGLGKVDREIVETKEDIAKLQTEIGVRASMAHLEAWNGTLGLKAPRPVQFASDGVQLAALVKGRGEPSLPLNPAVTAQVAIDKVAYQPAPKPDPTASITPAAPIEVPQQPLLRSATYVRSAPDRLGPVVPAPAPEAEAEQTALHRVALVAADPIPAKPKAKAHTAKASLLPDDIASLAASEAKGSKGGARALR